ncbi:MAG: hypothetical protein GTO63_16850, partial [Anaerolineae bacterium]|nr:hypothetical protein [Anaerolineae bacterium]NIN96467.1 hypothetical protein [Anaerolineae bacterium]
MYNAGDEAALIMHEMGHYVTFNLFSTKDRLDLWNTIVKSLPVNQRRSRSTRSSLSVADRDRLLVKGEFYDLLDEDPDAWFEWLDDG